MRSSIGNQDAYDTYQPDAIIQAIEMALYYPSLKGNPWDDELLPSED